jgi:hypothetical protein
VCDCGNGIVEPGEECENPISEDCGNMIDDNDDGLIDCHDPLCVDTGEPTCNQDCELVGPCRLIKRDPAIIKFKPGKPDLFRIHGRVDAVRGDFDPFVEGMTMSIFNNNGLIHSGWVLPGEFSARGGRRDGMPKRYRFRDRTAKTLGDATANNGVFRMSTRFRTICGTPSYTVKATMYADLSAATEALMTVQIYGVADVGAITAEWKKRNNGWILRLADAPDGGTGCN